MTKMYRDSEGKLQQHCYFNVNGFNVAIVAHEGGAKDYAAYIGGVPWEEDELRTVQFVLTHGNKLDSDLAKAIFPAFELAGLEYRL